MRTVDEMHMSPADVLTTAEQDVFGNFQPEKTGKNFSLEKVWESAVRLTEVRESVVRFNQRCIASTCPCSIAPSPSPCLALAFPRRLLCAWTSKVRCGHGAATANGDWQVKGCHARIWWEEFWRKRRPWCKNILLKSMVLIMWMFWMQLPALHLQSSTTTISKRKQQVPTCTCHLHIYPFNTKKKKWNCLCLIGFSIPLPVKR